MVKSIKLLLLFLLITSTAQAQSISGTSGSYTQGSDVTISGSSFSTHADYNSGEDYLSVTWNDWDTDGTGNSLEQGEIDVNGKSAEWVVQSGGRTNSTDYPERNYVATRLAPLRVTIGSDYTDTYYISFWFMYDNFASNAVDGKFFRLYWGDDSSRDNFFLATGGADFNLRGNSESKSNTTQYSSASQFQEGTWHHVEVLAIYTGVDTGTVTTWMDGVQQWSRTDWWDGGVYDPLGHTIQLANLIEYDDYGTFNFDDLNISYTQSRVMLCEGNTWSTRGKCETQTPLEWGASEIWIQFNAGAFVADDEVYLYVVDSSGTPSASNAITIGQEAGIPPLDDPNPGAVQTITTMTAGGGSRTTSPTIGF